MAEAVKWFRAAAEQGDDMAQYLLGVFYGRGMMGVAKDLKEAAEWLRKAAEHGDVHAKSYLKEICVEMSCQGA